jgi:hypothetical protein
MAYCSQVCQRTHSTLKCHGGKADRQPRLAAFLGLCVAAQTSRRTIFSLGWFSLLCQLLKMGENAGRHLRNGGGVRSS